ncbi:bromo-adjacent-like proteiny (BAH) domain-containing protein [Abeliophyllum distichum]|uniref:Bromo-adjacent-like proteiny (BAH) domain-containing protein n=1 Tax=Abeliophyllum distichum TaxID=126358 RepID=A0ABD1TWK4_9LAMI
MLHLEDEEDSELEEGELREYKEQKIEKKEEPELEVESENEEMQEETETEVDSENEGPEEPKAQPIGDVVRVSGEGEWRRNHYESFEYDGIIYNLEDPVLLVPQEIYLKPSVAILKDMTQTQNGGMMVTTQWFYRPEEAKKRGVGQLLARNARELFYSFHRDEQYAESVMHKCIVHFIPLNKQIPNRKKHPGFIVQNVYDTEQRRLFKLTDREFEDGKRHEIDLLIQKTVSRLGDLPDLEPKDNAVNQEDQRTNELLLMRNTSPLDVFWEDEEICRSHQSVKADTPGSTVSSTSKYYAILSRHKELTEETYRDEWLERLLKAFEFMCTPMYSKQNDGKGKSCADGCSIMNKISGSNHSDMSFDWPDAAVPAITALEKAAHDALSLDFQKYKQKMRHLTFNLKNNAALARRLLSGELEPSDILNMSPNELKVESLFPFLPLFCFGH